MNKQQKQNIIKAVINLLIRSMETEAWDIKSLCGDVYNDYETNYSYNGYAYDDEAVDNELMNLVQDIMAMLDGDDR